MTLRARMPQVGAFSASVSEPVTLTFTAPEPLPEPVRSAEISGPADAAWGSYPTLRGSTTGIRTGTTVGIDHLYFGTWFSWNQTVVSDNTFTYTLDFPVTGSTSWRISYLLADGTTALSAPFTITTPTRETGTSPSPVVGTSPNMLGGTIPGATTGTTAPNLDAVTGGATVGTPSADPQIAVTVKRATVAGALARKQVRKVTLQRQTKTGTWRKVKTKNTSSKTGNVKFSNLKRATTYRLYAPPVTRNAKQLPAAQSRTFTR